MPNPIAIINHAIAKAALELKEREHHSELHRKLDAILERLPAPPGGGCMTCKCFARCEADCVCDHDWTPPAVIALREEVDRLRAENADLRNANQILRDALDAERAELAARDAKPDCRTCERSYVTDLGFIRCVLPVMLTPIVCINGDAHVPADPVRLYETGEA